MGKLHCKEDMPYTFKSKSTVEIVVPSLEDRVKKLEQENEEIQSQLSNINNTVKGILRIGRGLEP